MENNNIDFLELSKNPNTFITNLLEINKIKPENYDSFVSGLLTACIGLEGVLIDNNLYNKDSPEEQMIELVEEKCAEFKTYNSLLNKEL